MRKYHCQFINTKNDQVKVFAMTEKQLINQLHKIATQLGQDINPLNLSVNDLSDTQSRTFTYDIARIKVQPISQ